MTSIVDFKNIIDEELHATIFLIDPTNENSNIYINKEYSTTLQQLIILANWEDLKQTIPESQLWIYLKAYEFRNTQFAFDGQSGARLENIRTSDNIYKHYYRNSLWLYETSLFTTLLFVLATIVILYLVFFFNGKDYKKNINLLNLLKASTILEAS